MIEYPPDGNVDAASFAAADRNHDGLLDTGEPFSVRLVLRGTSFRFYFNDVLQLAIDSGLPVPPPEGDRLLFGRNRWQWSSNPVAIRFDNLRRKPPAIPVSIDIMPGGSSNCINNNGRGLIPVAIFGSPALDVTRIDPATLRLESLAPRTVGPQRRPLTQIENINTDGFPDLMVQMRNVAGAFQRGAQTARLTGSLHDGTPLEGTDTICIVP